MAVLVSYYAIIIYASYIAKCRIKFSKMVSIYREKHVTVMQVYSIFITFSIQSCRSCYATQHLCQRSFYKIFVKFRNSKKNVLKIVLIIVNINKDENKSLISNQLSLKNDSPPPPPPHFLENYFAAVKIKKLKTITNHF